MPLTPASSLGADLRVTTVTTEEELKSDLAPFGLIPVIVMTGVGTFLGARDGEKYKNKEVRIKSSLSRTGFPSVLSFPLKNERCDDVGDDFSFFLVFSTPVPPHPIP